MAITLGSPYPFSNGTSSLQVDELISDNIVTQLNGLMGSSNMTGTGFVGREHIQRGSHVRVWQTSGTANLDYFSDTFQGYDTLLTFNPTANDVRQAIPGACLRFYLPWPARLLVMGGVHWGNNSTDDDQQSRIFLRFDDTYQTDHRRAVGMSVMSGLHYGVDKNRWWSCKQSIMLENPTDVDWHDVGLYIACDQGIEHTRVWARHMVVVAFRT